MELSFHRFMRDLHFMFIRAKMSQGLTFWTMVGLVAFAAVFLIVGLIRVVEFDGLGLSKKRRAILITFHVLGCITLALTFALLAIDVDKSHVSLIARFLFPGLLLLFPVHIYAGILRRVRLREAEEAAAKKLQAQRSKSL